MKRGWLAVCCAGLLVGCPTPEPTPEPDVPVVYPWDFPLPEDFAPVDDEFIVAVLPDTQIYAQQYPETFDGQLKWLAEWSEVYRIVFVSHVGDIVQHGDNLAEWEVAHAAYGWLRDAGVPHGTSVGGHDVSMYGGGDHDSSCSPFSRTDCDGVNYLEHFGPQEYEGKDWYGGASPSGLSSYQRVDAGAFELLFLHMPQDTPRAEVTWAHEVLDAHPGVLAHLTTHRYLLDYRLTDYLPSPLNLIQAGRFSPLTYFIGGQELLYLDGLEADDLFGELVSVHPNIWGVHCGHVDAEYRQTATNEAGLPVHEILVDYQDMAEGGGGWLRLLKFQPSQNQISVLSFSTQTGEVRENGDGFEHSIQLLKDYRRGVESELEQFGLDPEEIDGLIQQVEDDPEIRDGYYDSLYGEGQRDSRFVLEVDFQAYLDASR